jgi:putative membrane protein
MMAWIRTATSLISFGFTIYKFFELDLRRPASGTRISAIGPREFALMIISTGLVALILAGIQHHKSLVS